MLETKVRTGTEVTHLKDQHRAFDPLFLRVRAVSPGALYLGGRCHEHQPTTDIFGNAMSQSRPRPILAPVADSPYAVSEDLCDFPIGVVLVVELPSPLDDLVGGLGLRVTFAAAMSRGIHAMSSSDRATMANPPAAFTTSMKFRCSGVVRPRGVFTSMATNCAMVVSTMSSVISMLR